MWEYFCSLRCCIAFLVFEKYYRFGNPMLTLAHFSASVALLWHPFCLLFWLHDAAVV